MKVYRYMSLNEFTTMLAWIPMKNQNQHQYNRTDSVARYGRIKRSIRNHL